MRLFLILLTLVLGVYSVIFESDDTIETELELKEDDIEQQPLGRTFFLLQLLKQKLNKLHQLKQVQTLPPFIGCICVPFYLCTTNGTVITDGSGVIDFRQNRQCANAAEICCFIRTTNAPFPTAPPTTTSLPTILPLPTTTTRVPPTTRTIPPTIPTTMPTTTTTARPTTPPTIRPPTTTTTLRTTMQTLPTTPPTTRKITLPTLPTTSLTLPPIDHRTTIIPQQFCICVPIFQCAINSGNVVTGVPMNIDPRQQLASTCTGIFVCCNNVGYQQPAVTTTAPPFTLPLTLPTTPPTTTVATTTLLPALNLQQNCLCVLLAACSLGYMPWSDVNNIDPRMLVPRQGQSCSSTNSVCCRIGRQESAAESNIQPNFLEKLENEDIKNAGSANACRCVPVDDCPDTDTVSYDLEGTIDPRIGPCMSPVRVCCKLGSDRFLRSEVGVIDTNPSALIVTDTGIRANFATPNCGLRDTTYTTVVSPTPGSAYFAEFPWMALIIVRRPGTNDVVQCGGSLINSRVVMTAAHCVVSCDPRTLVARLGEWNTAVTTEPLPYQEITVQSVIVHPQFYQGALYHDVALLVLSGTANYAVNIRPVCLAAQAQQFATNTVCYASGWGSSAFGAQGQYQSVLRKVTLPIIDNANCQTRLRATRLGPSFSLHSSFICAGGQPNMDTCTKDGGGPLVCQDQTGRFIQTGIVSWGIGCGSAAPGVYASVAQHRQWIDQQVAALRIYN